jgi:hypothetical protein
MGSFRPLPPFGDSGQLSAIEVFYYACDEQTPLKRVPAQSGYTFSSTDFVQLTKFHGHSTHALVHRKWVTGSR